MTTTSATPSATAAAVPDRPRGQRGRRLVWYLSTTLLVAIIIYPIAWLLASSFKPASEIASSLTLLPSKFTGEHYRSGWTDVPEGTFFSYIVNSTIIATLAIVGNVLSCSLAAFAFARLRFRMRRLLFAITVGSLLMPAHVLIIPQYIIMRDLGWVDSILPLIVPKFLATEGFFVFLMVQFMRSLPVELDDAANIDGCGPFRQFWHIILPLTRPAIVTTSVFTFVWTWNDFYHQLVYLNSPEQYTVPLGLRLFVDVTSDSAFGPMFAMSVVSLVPIFLFFLIFQRLLVEGIATSGLKG